MAWHYAGAEARVAAAIVAARNDESAAQVVQGPSLFSIFTLSSVSLLEDSVS
jgi:hypothetical protein